MSFSADWLALRSEADSRARAGALTARLSAHFAGRRGLRVLDLGAGTGAMMAATAPVLGPGQVWRLADSDAGLLARVSAPTGVAVETVVADLSSGIAPLFDPPPDLVTASALLDLCGAGFLDRLASAAGMAGAAVYAVLNYDGREEWRPRHPLDRRALAAFHSDQRRDKGLGPALGPGAAARLAALLRAAGFEVLTAPSDWRLSRATDAPLIAALAAETGEAVAPALGVAAREWRHSRAAATAVTIGHIDLLAIPPASG